MRPKPFYWDGFNRLASAWTVADATTPTCGTDAPALGTAAWGASGTAYQATWVYTPAGKITSLTQSVADAASEVTGYAYSTSSPAAVTSTTTTSTMGTATDSFTYDAAGRMDSRTANSVTTGLSWDVTGSLVESGKPATAGDPSTGQGGHIVYAYDASGQRVLQAVVHDATHTGTATAYVASGEVTDKDAALPVATSTLGATRYYSFGGATVAVRTSTGLALVLGDEQGSVSVTMPLSVDPDTRVVSPATVADAQAVTRTAYTPFGVLGGDDNLALSRGWLGQVEDRVVDTGATSTGTGLTYLNARYYDPATSRFISPDPLMNPANPVTLDAYQYAANNPVAFSDANGMCYKGKGVRGYNGSTMEGRCGGPTDNDLAAAVTGTNIQATLAAQIDCRDKGKCGNGRGETLVQCGWSSCRGTPNADMSALLGGLTVVVCLAATAGAGSVGCAAAGGAVANITSYLQKTPSDQRTVWGGTKSAATGAVIWGATEYGGGLIFRGGAWALGKIGAGRGASAAADATVVWPPNNGFHGDFGTHGNTGVTVLKPGTLIDRFGFDSGTFASPKGTPVGARSLAPGTTAKPYSVFEVTKRLVVQEGPAAPWFDQPGMGTQYRLPAEVGDLIDAGFLRRAD